MSGSIDCTWSDFSKHSPADRKSNFVSAYNPCNSTRHCQVSRLNHTALCCDWRMLMTRARRRGRQSPVVCSVQLYWDLWYPTDTTDTTDNTDTPDTTDSTVKTCVRYMWSKRTGSNSTKENDLTGANSTSTMSSTQGVPSCT